MNHQTLRRLEQLEGQMGARDDTPQFAITIDWVEALDGAPSGKVTRVRYDTRGEVISTEELFIDPATLRAHGGKR